MIFLDHRDSRPIYEQIVESLRRQIQSGVMAPGDKLPSVRELSASLSINPNTIQRAYRELEAGGWIESHPGKGSFVCPQKTEPDAEYAELFKVFDDAARELIRQGVPTARLLARLKSIGGEHHA